MDLETLDRLFPSANGKALDEILALTKRLEAVRGTFYAVIAERDNKFSFEFTSSSCETVTGYPPSKFAFFKGFPFIYSITAGKENILVQEAAFLKKARQSDFDPTEAFVLEMTGSIHHSDGSLVSLLMTSVILRFTPDRQFQFTINVWQVPDQNNKSSNSEIKKILLEIHRIYMALNPPILHGNPKQDMIRLSYPLYDPDMLTKREIQVLKLLADGLSSKQIASLLHTSQNTIGSHRRHLLDKFQSANVAELIKKATKVYWLE